MGGDPSRAAEGQRLVRACSRPQVAGTRPAPARRPRRAVPRIRRCLIACDFIDATGSPTEFVK
eukprot:1767552-Alexandrium_andersonii.AAC.1